MKRLLSLVAVLLLLPSLLWAQSAVLGPAANPPDAHECNYRTTACQKDEFMGGNAISSSIGELSWQVTGGTTTVVAPEAGHPGIIRRDTSASSGTAAYLYNGTATRTFLASESYTQLWYFRLNQTDANTKARIGAMNAVADPSTNGIYLEKLDADTNWFCVTRASSSETRVDSGVATGTGWVKVEIIKSVSNVTWKINNTPVCGIMTATLPTAAQFPIAFIINSAAASKTMDVEYYEMNLTGLSR